jgi:hypothetical protein
LLQDPGPTQELVITKWTGMGTIRCLFSWRSRLLQDRWVPYDTHHLYHTERELPLAEHGSESQGPGSCLSPAAGLLRPLPGFSSAILSSLRNLPTPQGQLFCVRGESLASHAMVCQEGGRTVLLVLVSALSSPTCLGSLGIGSLPLQR